MSVFNGVPDDATSPIRKSVAATQSDTVDQPDGPYRAINVAGEGIVRVTQLDDTTVDVYVAAGIWFGQWLKRVHSSGTTATGIVVGK